MLSSQLKLSALWMPNTLWSSHFGNVVECAQFQPSTTYSIYSGFPPKTILVLNGFRGSFTSLDPCEASSTIVNTGETSDAVESCERKMEGNPTVENSTKEIQLGMHFDFSHKLSYEEYIEYERKRKIGLGNKGKVPWNKGRKHSAETREKIQQRTKEAMKDPKIRKKLAVCPRAHSKPTKKKIGSSLKQIWHERLKWKRTREEFLLSWAKSIAAAAKEGGIDQQELEWDSYEKMKTELALQQIQLSENQAKAKEMAKKLAQERAERAAQAKAEKMARLAQRREEREQKEKAAMELKRKRRKKRGEHIEEDPAFFQELSLKDRLKEIQRKKPVSNQITSQDRQNWEALDMGFMKSELLQKEVSLADQIRAAKSKRSEFSAIKEGGVNQQELEWDRYEKMNSEVARQQLQWVENEGKAKKKAQANAEKMARLAQKTEEQEKKKKEATELKRKGRKKEDLGFSQELSLKDRLRKIRRKKPVSNPITCQDRRNWEALDMGIMKSKLSQEEVSLADQIQAAKIKRSELSGKDVSSSSSSTNIVELQHKMNQEPGQ